MTPRVHVTDARVEAGTVRSWWPTTAARRWRRDADALARVRFVVEVV